MEIVMGQTREEERESDRREGRGKGEKRGRINGIKSKSDLKEGDQDESKREKMEMARKEERTDVGREELRESEWWREDGRRGGL